MKILFLGQKGVPVLGSRSDNSVSREQRVEALATRLAENGHDVSVSCASPFVSANLRRFNGVALKHLFSLDPGKPGGWIHSLLALKLMWKESPEAVHMHGWRMAAMAPLAVLLNPEATFIWTADSLPAKTRIWHRLAARLSKKVCDVVTAPTRQLQYRLLNEAGVRAVYVPDGFDSDELADIPAGIFGLRKGQYCLTLATDINDLRWIAKAYKQAKTRKKLVAMVEDVGAYKRLKRSFKFLHFAGFHGSRGASSLINQAAAIILAGSDVRGEMVLRAMNSGNKLVATTDPLFQELVGATAPFVKDGDIKGLAEVLNEIVSSGVVYKRRTKSQRRARANFGWARITREYTELYHGPAVVLVPFDSALGKPVDSANKKVLVTSN